MNFTKIVLLLIAILYVTMAIAAYAFSDAVPSRSGVLFTGFPLAHDLAKFSVFEAEWKVENYPNFAPVICTVNLNVTLYTNRNKKKYMPVTMFSNTIDPSLFKKIIAELDMSEVRYSTTLDKIDNSRLLVDMIRNKKEYKVFVNVLAFPYLLIFSLIIFAIYLYAKHYAVARRASRGLCKQCGYVLDKGNKICPECGLVT